jgi:hypothetical protein
MGEGANTSGRKGMLHRLHKSKEIIVFTFRYQGNLRR